MLSFLEKDDLKLPKAESLPWSLYGWMKACFRFSHGVCLFVWELGSLDCTCLEQTFGAFENINNISSI